MGVVPQQLCVDHHAGQGVAVHRQYRALLLGETEAQGHGLVGAAAGQFFAEILQVTVADLHQFAQSAQGGLEVRHTLPDKGQYVRRAIVGQQHTVAVEDQAALGGQRLQLHAIALRLGAVGLVMGDLQAVIPGQDHRQRDTDDDDGGDGAGTVDPGFPDGILECNLLWHVPPCPEPRWSRRDDTGG